MSRLGLRSLNSQLVPRRFHPRRIPNCTAWFDGGDLVTKYQTDDTSTPVTADNDPWGRWADKSGAGLVLTQATANERPAWRNQQSGANGIGALVTAAANGAGSDWLGGSVTVASLFGAAQGTLFVVFRSSSPQTSQRIIGDSGGFFFLGYTSGTNLRARLWNGTQAQSEADITIAGDTTYICCVRRDSQPHLFLSVNGGTETDVASAGNLNFGGGELRVPTTQAGAKHAGWVGQVIAYSRSLSTRERNRLGRHLASLYGTTWTNQ